ncbi:MAG: hypothetical protein IT322_06170 [Anaerolineae bacterium]|nr:hypothetical protein [Anaerolineae bacterium]
MVEHITPVSDDYFDIFINAKFVEKLGPSDVVKVSQIILEVINSKAVEGTFLVGLATMEVSLEKVQLQFRFSKRPEDIVKLNAADRDELPRKMARFTWHLFARVDSNYRLHHTNLPNGFRYYTNLEE